MREIMDKTGRQVIVAGGTGFIGRAQIPELRDAGYEIIVLSRAPRPYSAAGWGDTASVLRRRRSA